MVYKLCPKFNANEAGSLWLQSKLNSKIIRIRPRLLLVPAHQVLPHTVNAHQLRRIAGVSGRCSTGHLPLNTGRDIQMH
jgi:hypothetical protein